MPKVPKHPETPRKKHVARTAARLPQSSPTARGAAAASPATSPVPPSLQEMMTAKTDGVHNLEEARDALQTAATELQDMHDKLSDEGKVCAKWVCVCVCRSWEVFGRAAPS